MCDQWYPEKAGHHPSDISPPISPKTETPQQDSGQVVTWNRVILFFQQVLVLCERREVSAQSRGPLSRPPSQPGDPEKLLWIQAGGPSRHLYQHNAGRPSAHSAWLCDSVTKSPVCTLSVHPAAVPRPTVAACPGCAAHDTPASACHPARLSGALARCPP